MLKKRWKLTLKQKIYIFVLVAGFINILMPCIVHADVYGADIPDLYEEITENVGETNDLLKEAYKLSQVSPITVFNEMKIGGLENVHTASQTVALVVATLLLIVDFFRKTVNFEWSSKWENVLLFLIKIIVLKQVVQNADTILSYVYGLFNYINKKVVSISDDNLTFLPWSKKSLNYEYYTFGEILQETVAPWWKVIKNIAFGTSMEGTEIKHKYVINEDAVRMFYPYATFPDVKGKIKFMETFIWNAPGNGTGDHKLSFNPTIERIFLFPYFLFMKLIAYFIFVIVIGRLFELCVYTILAPLPIATFASEVGNDIAKNFLKNYIACVLQMAVIATMFCCYVTINQYVVDNLPKNIKLLQVIVLASLALGVAKSGEWSKKICGA